MSIKVTREDCFGLARPGVDALTLGISSVEQILKECGIRAVVADAAICDAFGVPEDARNMAAIQRWLRQHRITQLGFSYRLDPSDGASIFGRLVRQLRNSRLLEEQGGPIRGLFFAGLPETCELVRKEIPEVRGVFSGDETAAETLRTLGVAATALPAELSRGLIYDEDRLSFGRDLVRKGNYLAVTPLDRTGYDGFGTRRDTVVARIRHGVQRKLPPLMRAHVGPYLGDHAEAVKTFLGWSRELAAGGCWTCCR